MSYKHVTTLTLLSWAEIMNDDSPTKEHVRSNYNAIVSMSSCIQIAATFSHYRQRFSRLILGRELAALGAKPDISSLGKIRSSDFYGYSADI